MYYFSFFYLPAIFLSDLYLQTQQYKFKKLQAVISTTTAPSCTLLLYTLYCTLLLLKLWISPLWDEAYFITIGVWRRPHSRPNSQKKTWTRCRCRVASAQWVQGCWFIREAAEVCCGPYHSYRLRVQYVPLFCSMSVLSNKLTATPLSSLTTCSISLEEHVQQPVGGGRLGRLRPDLSWVPQIN